MPSFHACTLLGWWALRRLFLLRTLSSSFSDRVMREPALCSIVAAAGIKEIVANGLTFAVDFSFSFTFLVFTLSLTSSFATV